MANENAIQRATVNAVSRTVKPKTMQDYIKQMEGEIAKALPSVITPARFTRITLSALSANPKLAGTTYQSFLAAMMTAAQLGMEPNTPLGQAHLIPFWNNKKKQSECQFQIGYRGLIDLAYRNKEVILVEARSVYENDQFFVEFGLEPILKHIPTLGDKGAVLCFYAQYQTKDGGHGFEVMTLKEIEQHAKKHSQSYENGPWKSNFEAMAKKTVLKKVLKYAPLSIDVAHGLSSDGVIRSELAEDMFDVASESIEVDGYVIDDSTSEVVEGPAEAG